MVLLSLAGLLSYGQLGRDEDPPLTIKVMVVRAIWPGGYPRRTQHARSRIAWKKPCSHCSGSTTSQAIPSRAKQP